MAAEIHRFPILPEISEHRTSTQGNLANLAYFQNLLNEDVVSAAERETSEVAAVQSADEAVTMCRPNVDRGPPPMFDLTQSI